MHVVPPVSAQARCLILPGNDLCAAFYARLASELTERALPTATSTLPGYAGIPPLPAPGWQALVECVLPHVPEVLVGHSMGGLLALLVAARRPARLRGLVLLEPALFPFAWLARSAARAYLRRVVLERTARFENWNGAQRRIADPASYPSAMIELYREVRATSDVETARVLFATLPTLYPLPFRALDVPVLLIRGGASGPRARLLSALLALRLRPTVQRALPGAAHWIANERDAEAAQVIADFAASCAPANQ